MRHATRKFMDSEGICEMNVPAEGFAAFKEQTKSFLEVRWQEVTRPEHLKEAMEMYGFDCYMQGLLDASNPQVQALLHQPSSGSQS